MKWIGFSLLALLLTQLQPVASASEGVAARQFDAVRHDPVALRDFLFRFPKGGDLHSHIDGAVYAENMIRWAAEDGHCVNLAGLNLVPAPCDAGNGRPAVKDVALDAAVVNRLIDAFSTRNFEHYDVSGHQQFFASFGRFYLANIGREGDMLAEVTSRAARQNTYYIELMQGFGMSQVRARAAQGEPISEAEYQGLLSNAVTMLDAAEARRAEIQGCDGPTPERGCAVKVNYLAQILRTFPRRQVRAQTRHAANLIQHDPRVVGLNFVAPEDAPVTLRDYSWQMQMIAEETRHLPEHKRNITLHAGELTLGLVRPRDLGFHIREAVEIAGAKRIGHGVDIVHDINHRELLRQMAAAPVAVEINLTSNADILGVVGDEHPFNLYRSHGVPLTLSTDDEGISRIDLTHEYQRAVQSYDLDYRDIKQLARNALTYSFLPGGSLWSGGRVVSECRRQNFDQPMRSKTCRQFLDSSEKARQQWQLEKALYEFESSLR